jgi:mono/diheme cytochrome c family protein
MALYNQYCSGCHGQGMRGESATSTKSAINNNKGGMGFLSSLTSAQLTAISQY